jgi:hypothetical protein
MKNEHDLAYDRISREDIAKETATYLSVQYDSVLRYLEASDTAGAERLKANNEALNFKELKNIDFASFTDDQLTKFLKTAGQYSRDFHEIGYEIAKEQFADRLG